MRYSIFGHCSPRLLQSLVTAEFQYITLKVKCDYTDAGGINNVQGAWYLHRS